MKGRHTKWKNTQTPSHVLGTSKMCWGWLRWGKMLSLSKSWTLHWSQAIPVALKTEKLHFQKKNCTQTLLCNKSSCYTSLLYESSPEFFVCPCRPLSDNSKTIHIFLSQWPDSKVLHTVQHSTAHCTCTLYIVQCAVIYCMQYSTVQSVVKYWTLYSTVQLFVCLQSRNQCVFILC